MSTAKRGPAKRQAKPWAVTAENALSLPAKAFLSDNAARAALEAIGTACRPRMPRDDDGPLVAVMQHIARHGTMLALMGQHDGNEAAQRAKRVREADNHLKHAVKLLKRVATVPGHAPPKVWCMKEWQALQAWFATEYQRKRDRGPPKNAPARQWATARLLAVYERAAGAKATPGGGDAAGPTARFLRAWRDGARAALNGARAGQAADALAPAIVDRKEIFAAIGAMDNAPEAEAARWPAGTTVAWSPRREVASWLPGGEFPLQIL